MGGYASGQWHRWNTKETTAGLRAVDVRYLHRQGSLQPGTIFHLRWSRNGEEMGSISGVTGKDQVTLHYRLRPSGQDEEEVVTEPIWLEWTSCHYGGQRPWFRCPGRSCGRRVVADEEGGTGATFRQTHQETCHDAHSDPLRCGSHLQPRRAAGAHRSRRRSFPAPAARRFVVRGERSGFHGRASILYSR
jgi:hypothetical protein